MVTLVFLFGLALLVAASSATLCHVGEVSWDFSGTLPGQTSRVGLAQGGNLTTGALRVREEIISASAFCILPHDRAVIVERRRDPSEVSFRLISASSGERLWRRNLIDSNPSPTEPRLVCSRSDRLSYFRVELLSESIYIDRTTGRTLWTDSTLPSAARLSRPLRSLATVSPPGAYQLNENAEIYNTNERPHQVIGVDPQSGRQLWRTDAQGGRVVRQTESAVYLSRLKDVTKLDRSTGQVKWTAENFSLSLLDPFQEDSPLYGTNSRSNKLCRLRALDGGTEWCLATRPREAQTFLVKGSGDITQVHLALDFLGDVAPKRVERFDQESGRLRYAFDFVRAPTGNFSGTLYSPLVDVCVGSSQDTYLLLGDRIARIDDAGAKLWDVEVPPPDFVSQSSASECSVENVEFWGGDARQVGFLFERCRRPTVIVLDRWSGDTIRRS